MPPQTLTPALLATLLEPYLGRRVLFAFDFDGTLVEDNLAVADRKIAATEAARLAHLAKHQPVAVVTGRSVATTVPVLGFQPTWVVGDHGSEGLPALPFMADVTFRAQTSQAIEAEHDALRCAGIAVEQKANTYTFHFQDAADTQKARATVDALLRKLPEGWQAFPGRGLVDLLPVGMPDKADAVLQLEQASAADLVVFMGDGSNDECVFQRAKPHWLTIKVGTGNPTAARWRLAEGPIAVHQAIALLLSRTGDPA